jgi:hypothetical protein
MCWRYHGGTCPNEGSERSRACISRAQRQNGHAWFQTIRPYPGPFEGNVIFIPWPTCSCPSMFEQFDPAYEQFLLECPDCWTYNMLAELELEDDRWMQQIRNFGDRESEERSQFINQCHTTRWRQSCRGQLTNGRFLVFSERLSRVWTEALDEASRRLDEPDCRRSWSFWRRHD